MCGSGAAVSTSAIEVQVVVPQLAGALDPGGPAAGGRVQGRPDRHRRPGGQNPAILGDLRR